MKKVVSNLNKASDAVAAAIKATDEDSDELIEALTNVHESILAILDELGDGEED